jgi:hypothetical protein
MKITIFAFCLLFATASFGQTASVLSNVPQPTVIPEHPQHASQHAMAPENSLLGTSAYSYAQGEQPVVEFGSLKQENSSRRRCPLLQEGPCRRQEGC